MLNFCAFLWYHLLKRAPVDYAWRSEDTEVSRDRVSVAILVNSSPHG